MTREEAKKVFEYLEKKANTQEPCDECRYKRTSICGNCKEYDEFEEVDFVQEHKKIPVTLDLTPCDDAISRDAVLKIIDKWYENKSDIEDLIILITYMSSVTQKSGMWIPVSERLPEVGISVLVSDADSDIYFTHITRNGVFFDEWGNEIKGIIAWMPLPEPYEPQESEDNE